MARTKTGSSKEETAVIGDRLYTDIACGVNAGITSIFVLSGEGTREDIASSDAKPTYVLENIKELLDYLES
ncbi:MAG: HAD hydrolase-like protein [Clostridia bacterium]|nr:HAD hydrolase-like protein [Clostridia bacterium]